MPALTARLFTWIMTSPLARNIPFSSPCPCWVPSFQWLNSLKELEMYKSDPNRDITPGYLVRQFQENYGVVQAPTFPLITLPLKARWLLVPHQAGILSIVLLLPPMDKPD